MEIRVSMTGGTPEQVQLQARGVHILVQSVYFSSRGELEIVCDTSTYFITHASAKGNASYGYASADANIDSSTIRVGFKDVSGKIIDLRKSSGQHDVGTVTIGIEMLIIQTEIKKTV